MILISDDFLHNIKIYYFDPRFFQVVILNIISYLSYFHKQALDSCKRAFKHNYPPHTFIMWNNTYKNRTIFNKERVIFIKKYIDTEGTLISYETCCKENNISENYEWHMLIKSSVRYSSVLQDIPCLMILVC